MFPCHHYGVLKLYMDVTEKQKQTLPSYVLLRTVCAIVYFAVNRTIIYQMNVMLYSSVLKVAVNRINPSEKCLLRS